jgi:hypothetical protein
MTSVHPLPYPKPNLALSDLGSNPQNNNTRRNPKTLLQGLSTR